MGVLATAYQNLSNSYSAALATIAQLQSATQTLTPVQTAAIADITDQADVDAANSLISDFGAPSNSPTPSA